MPVRLVFHSANGAGINVKSSEIRIGPSIALGDMTNRQSFENFLAQSPTPQEQVFAMLNDMKVAFDNWYGCEGTMALKMWARGAVFPYTRLADGTPILGVTDDAFCQQGARIENLAVTAHGKTALVDLRPTQVDFFKRINRPDLIAA